VKKTFVIKLVPDASQEVSLMKTTHTFRDVCNWLSEKAFDTKQFNKVVLQRFVYKECREKFQNFSSQLVVRAIGVVCDAYKLRKDKLKVFHKEMAVYDARILSWKDDKASLWTIDGRIKIPIQVWNQKLFGRAKGQADLIRKNGKWFLMTTVDIPEQEPIEPKGWLGVDLGIVNLATTSDGTIFTGEAIERSRQRFFEHRQRLQKRNTKSSRKRIRTTGHKEARFRKDVNHVISKNLVRKAKGTFYGIALEDLKGIRKRTTVKKVQRAKHTGWAFAQLRSFIEYKAKQDGIPVRLVPARNTSKGCSSCGHIDARNRKSQVLFCCISCGHTENADLNASRNIAFRAAVNQPIVSKCGHKPTALAVGS
jgi:IS605 OrfB family transposase